MPSRNNSCSSRTSATGSASNGVIGRTSASERDVLWGSGCVWFGSLRPQLEAFSAREISPELQEEHGYPALTPERKAMILGLNGARLCGIDPEETRCSLDTHEAGQLEQVLDGELGGRWWALSAPQRSAQSPRVPATHEMARVHRPAGLR